MTKKIILSLFFSAIFLSCSKHRFSEFESFGEDNRWQKTAPKTFEFEIVDDSKAYNLIFQFSHVYDYQFTSVPVNFTIVSPDGKTENIPIVLMIKDSNGKELADCSGDVCDLSYTVKENARLQKGKYKVTIANSFERPYLPNVIGIGMNVDEVKR